MKYDQIEDLEFAWKLDYCNKKMYEKTNLTKYKNINDINDIHRLLNESNNNDELNNLIIKHFNEVSLNKIKQAIRAKRKRFYNAQNKATKKKSIDLNYDVWVKLSEKSISIGATLSETIEYLLSESNKKKSVSKKVNDIKNDLNQLLNL